MTPDFSKLNFKPSPHKPLVIMSGYSEAGRVYPHSGVRTKAETYAIQSLWMASAELYELLKQERDHLKEELTCFVGMTCFVDSHTGVVDKSTLDDFDIEYVEGLEARLIKISAALSKAEGTLS